MIHIHRYQQPGSRHLLRPAEQLLSGLCPEDVIVFWKTAGPSQWFVRNPDFDRTFRERFLQAHLAAASGMLSHWETSPLGALALILLLDRFPRRAFRGTARMYATDPLARRYASQAVDGALDLRIADDLRQFFYLPYSHSEVLADQERALALASELGEDARRITAARREVVLRFGRFPHRNAVLGRTSTPLELAFLASLAAAVAAASPAGTVNPAADRPAPVR